MLQSVYKITDEQMWELQQQQMILQGLADLTMGKPGDEFDSPLTRECIAIQFLAPARRIADVLNSLEYIRLPAT